MADTRPLAGRKEVAEHLGVPFGTLVQWAHRGIGPRYIKVGRHAKYRWSDVDAWLSQQQSGGSPVSV